MNEKIVFVTVGTTFFDSLIQCILSTKFINQILTNGYNRLIVQYGKGQLPVQFLKPNDFQENNDVVATSQKVEFCDENGSMSGEFIRVNQSSSFTMVLKWEVYRFKASLAKDMKQGDLIISHAGAGSIMEALELNRERLASDINDSLHSPSNKQTKLVVVINDLLMDNHQIELAEALGQRGYLYVATKPHVLLEDDIMKKIDLFQPRHFEGGDPFAFGRIMYNFLGYVDQKNA